MNTPQTRPVIAAVAVMATVGALTVSGPAASQPWPACAGVPATIVGTDDNNTLVGTPGRDVIVALGGDDHVYARGGNDLVCGGDGNDVIYGGSGDDVLRGGNGSDVLLGGPGRDRLIGWRGDDTLRGQVGAGSMLSGGPGLDLCLSYRPYTAAACEDIVRVSVAVGGGEPNGDSAPAAVSAHGRYVVFASAATNLVPDDTNGVPDVFVHDADTGRTTRVSVASGGAQAVGNADGLRPGVAISAHGRYIAFDSDAANLVAGDTNHARDVFVHDVVTGETVRVSVDSHGRQGNGSSSGPSISADGRYIAYSSTASNLVPGDTNHSSDVFVFDRTTGKTTRASVTSDGDQANARSGAATLSGDGRYVAFATVAALTPEDTDHLFDVYVHDRDTGQTQLVSRFDDAARRETGAPALSADGRYICFFSDVEDNTGASEEMAVLIRDMVTGTLRLASVASDGSPFTDLGSDSAISGDGRYVAFDATGANGDLDVFAHDEVTGATSEATLSTDGHEPSGGAPASGLLAMSSDARYVVFSSVGYLGTPMESGNRSTRDVFTRIMR